MTAGGCGERQPEEELVSRPVLAPCPESPNCVSSKSTDTAHHAEPIAYGVSFEVALHRLRAIVGSMPRTRITRDEGHYLRVEFRSRLAGFVDDVEFLADCDDAVIHVRSASRIGYWDLGANRRRVEQIRRLFEAWGVSDDSERS